MVSTTAFDVCGHVIILILISTMKVDHHSTNHHPKTTAVKLIHFFAHFIYIQEASELYTPKPITIINNGRVAVTQS